jgi:16S rRNA (adenine1518-N6/adenine1519-N6)-dimethyltransferase
MAGVIAKQIEPFPREESATTKFVVNGSKPLSTASTEAKKLFKVSAGCFVPAPKVDSAVVRIDLYKTPKYTPKNEKLFRDLIRAAFEMRRKTLQNALSAKLQGYTKDEIKDAIVSIGYPETVRGECLSTEDFVKLSDLLIENHK